MDIDSYHSTLHSISHVGFPYIFIPQLPFQKHESRGNVTSD